MATFAAREHDVARTPPRAALALKHADLALLAIALPVFVLGDLPLVGYAALAGVWLVQHAIHELATRRSVAAVRSGRRQLALGLFGAATLARVWLVALVVLMTGVIGDREDGLAAALLAAALVTVHLAGRGAARLVDPDGPEKR